MNGIEYFENLASGGHPTCLSEFRSHWENTRIAPVVTEAFLEFFLATSRVFDFHKDNRTFNYRTDYESARQIVFDYIRGIVEDPQILGHSFSYAQISDVFKSCLMIKFMPQNGFKNKLIEGTKSVLPSADEESCYKFMNSFAELAIYPGDEWIQKWWNRTLEHLDRVKNFSLYNIAYRLAILDYLRSQEAGHLDEISPCREIATNILQTYKDNLGGILEGKNIIPRQIQYVALWFDFDLQLKDKILEPETDKHSQVEERFRYVFSQQAGLSLTDPLLTKFGHNFDISFQFNSRSFAIEIDGEPHMLRGTMDGNLYYDGASRFQTALAEKTMERGLSLIRIPTVYLIHERGFNVQQIAKAALDASGSINGTPVIMHGLNKFVPKSQPDCWKLG